MSDIELVIVNAHELAAILDYMERLKKDGHFNGEIEIAALLARLRDRVKFTEQIDEFK